MHRNKPELFCPLNDLIRAQETPQQMKIRGRTNPSDSECSPSLSQSSSPSSSSSSSYYSSITAANSLASSQNSSDSCPSPSHRCHGLDLLVKAIHQVTAGSAIGVPYIQRRVTIRRRRRRRGMEFDAFVFDELSKRKWKVSGGRALGSEMGFSF